eukprot:TRINITY_DN60413_c0_g1_i2.p1 TRINITY_DN60413_c0_g1~~TRINITY_DN60413_c0_g1_i2.p1  ORF type:complete len:117 (-),score=23.01 TRINITY_DN60413_c0_g1_i2:96-446(-)
METGSVLGFGANSAGQLGLDDCTSKVVMPRRVAPQIGPVQRVIAGGRSSVVLDSSPSTERTISHLTLSQVSAMVFDPAQHGTLIRLCREVHSSVGCLSSSFLKGCLLYTSPSPRDS